MKHVKSGNRIDVAIDARELYEHRFGIHNLSERTVFGSCTFHEAEDYYENSYLTKLIDNFFNKNVHEITGYTLDQFISLPYVYSSLILERIDAYVSKKNKVVAKAMKDIDK